MSDHLPDQITWLRGLRGTADVNGRVFRSVPDPLWLLALDVIEALETWDTAEPGIEDAVLGLREARDAFLLAAEEARA